MTYSALSVRPYAGRPALPHITSITIPNIGRTVMYVTLGCLLGMVYLVQVTRTNALGYQVNNYNVQATALRAENDDLTLASARLQSLDRIQHSDVASALVAVTPQ